MVRTTAYVVTALVLIGLGVAAKQGWFGDADQSAQNETKLPVIAPAPAGAITESAISSSAQLHESNNAISVQAPTSSSVSMRSVSPESTRPVILQPDHGSESQSSVSIDAAASDPDAIIDRPFPMSGSVEASCRLVLKKGEDACDRVHQVLAEMAHEPRDPAWAAATEAKLRALILADPNQYTIRALECRTSLCAVDVASIFGQYLGLLQGDTSLEKGLWRSKVLLGYEHDPSGARITVTLYTFERRR